MARVRCRFEVAEMAGLAVRRKPLILPHRGAFMTGFALDCGVSADQRETILMLFDRLKRYLPTEHRVALGAVRAEFPAVNIGVTIRAVSADVGEDGLHVALGAGDFLVHSATRISSFAVVEFGHGADRPPARVGVAVFAGDGEVSVRTSSTLPLHTDIGSERRPS